MINKERQNLIEIYDLYRTIFLNVKYYSYRLNSKKRSHLCIEIVAAIMTSATILSTTFWVSNLGKYSIIPFIIAIGTVVKPFINTARDIEKYSRLLILYKCYFSEIESIVLHIKQNAAITEDDIHIYCQARGKIDALQHDDDTAPSGKLQMKCYVEVKNELPSKSLWMPRDIKEDSDVKNASE